MPATTLLLNDRQPLANFSAPLRDFFRHRLWQDASHGAGARFGLKSLRILILAGRGLIRNQALVRSSALAYAAILGFIPLLALLFAILQAMGLPRLLAETFLANLAPGSEEFARQILRYIEDTKVTSLGVFGVVALLLDLVIVMANVERAFNQTWQVSKTRPLSRKVSDYLSIFLIFPILMAVALSISTSFLGLRLPELHQLLAGIVPGVFFTAARWLVSLGIVWLAFIFIYLVMPNARVRFWSAVIGGVMGGCVWQVAQWIFVWFQEGATYYNAIFGALYNLLFLCIWMFWCWLIVLFGNEVAFAHQHLDRLSRQWRRPPAPPEPVDEYLGLAALVSISARFYQKQPPLTLEELAQTFTGGNQPAQRVARLLLDCGLVMEVAPPTAAASPQYLPAVPLDQVTVQEVLDQLRQARGTALAQALDGEPQLTALLQRLAEAPSPAERQSLTLQDLVREMDQELREETATRKNNRQQAE